MGLKPKDCILIGDRLETDIKWERFRIATGLVLTGVTAKKPLRITHSADFVFGSIVSEELVIEE